MIVRSSLKTEGIKLLKCPPPGDDYILFIESIRKNKEFMKWLWLNIKTVGSHDLITHLYYNNRTIKFKKKYIS